MKYRSLQLSFLVLLTALLAACKSTSLVVPTAEVAPIVETDEVPNDGDAADDAAIWIHPTDPTQSTIIATDKQSGLVVYDLEGNEVQYLAVGRPNNVDLRYNFWLGGEAVALVTASNRTDNTIGIYKMNPDTRKLEHVAASSISVELPEAYGSCMYHSPSSRKHYVFITTKSMGGVTQFELLDNGNGQVDAQLVRSFDVGSQTEGCVADDELGHFYIAEENVGIWKYGAEPDDDETRTLVDVTDRDGNLTADVEGLTLYYATANTGYLIASSQGDSRFVIYERQGDNAYVGTFRIIANDDIDGVSGTDGIDVTNFPLNDTFPAGVFVAQDDNNPGDNQNFKLLAWQDIANAFEPPLLVETSWDPRLIGAE